MSLERSSAEEAGPETAPAIAASSQAVDYTRFAPAGFARRYLATYFQEIDPDERAIAEFLVREYPKLQGVSTLLDLGCGPGVQHVLPAAPYVERIDMADFLPDNLAELHAWRTRRPEGHDWSHFTQAVLQLEGEPADAAAIAAREEALRRKLGAIERADVLAELPFGEPRRYPAIGFFYCAEAVARTRRQWAAVVGRVAQMVEHDGMLFMASLRNATYYTIDHPDGGAERLATASVNERDFAEVLPRLGFDQRQTRIEVVSTPGMGDHGIQEIILVARKLDSPAY